MSDVGICALLCGGFVGTIFLWRKERTFALLCMKDIEKAWECGPEHLDRNDPSTFRRRLISFVGSTAVSWLVLEYLLFKEARDKTSVGPSAVIHFLFCQEGNVLRALHVTVSTALATLALFSGTLLEKGIALFQQDANEIFLRDNVICPTGEEIFFRALLLQILLQRRSVTSSIVISSALFAVSHTHHIFPSVAWEYRYIMGNNEPQPRKKLVCWRRAAKKLPGLYLCTFACGLLTGYCYVVVGKRNLPSTIVTHALCNFIGPPTFDFLQEKTWLKRLVYGGAYCGGIAGWYIITSTVARRST
uniref:intramembrane prenyl-peptidase Rce1 n=1 Tax=Trypanosoma brucei TaxID=5691 RepID=Q0PIL0_9TRYP|nr:type II CAAX prenyl protease [Trypanosoma brucei]